MSDEEKTEDPTSRQLDKAKEEGNVAKSKELPAAVTLTAAVAFLYFYAPFFIKSLTALMREYFLGLHYPLDTQSLYKLMFHATIETIKITAPFLTMLLVVGIAVNIMQVGWMFSMKALEIKLDRLNPFKGFGKFFNKKSLVELLKSLFKIFVISYVAYLVIKKHIGTVVGMADMDINDIMRTFGAITFEIMWKVCLLAIIMAILDYIFQKYQYKQDLKMSKHEVKEERKQMEGDPQVKNRIRSIQRDMARQRMMEDVPQADVVVTNPTHYAVAIRYNPGEDRAPVVLAKGQRLVALRIREVARENGILIHEDPPVARSLFKTVDIGEEIPENLYKAVAEILALVDKFKRTA